MAAIKENDEMLVVKEKQFEKEMLEKKKAKALKFCN